MTSFTLSDHQTALVERPIESKIFLEGPAGTGKTTAGVGRLLHLLASGVPAGTVLVVVSLEHRSTDGNETTEGDAASSVASVFPGRGPLLAAKERIYGHDRYLSL